MKRLLAKLGVMPGNPDYPGLYGFAVGIALSPVLGAIFALLGIFSPWYGLLFPVAGAVLVVAAIPLIRKAQRFQAEITQLQNGECLARWEFSAAEWQGWFTNQWRDNRKRVMRQSTLMAIPILVSTALLPPFFTNSRDGDLAIIAAVIGLILVGVWMGPRQLTNARGAATVELLIGPRGYLVNNHYMPLVNAGAEISGAVIQPGSPSVIEFAQNRMPGRFAAALPDARLPIPHGREREAELIVQRYVEQ